MRQAGLKPKSHSSGVYWIRANSSPNGGGKSFNEEATEPFGVLDTVLWLIIIPVLLVSLPVFLLYELYRMISGRG